jgi:predicted regulator of Ras-like GTPase activity (Roadblock/LC7/MglB family)
MSSKSKEVEARMERVVADYPYIMGWAVVSRDGINMVSDLGAELDDQLVGTVAAAVLSIGDKWSETQHDMPVEYVLMGHNGRRTVFLPAGRDGALVLLLKAGGDWNQIVAAACSLADEFGRLLDSGMI